MRSLLRFLLPSSLAILIFVVALPRPALWLDGKLALVWRLPVWTEPLALAFILAGAALAIWSCWKFASDSRLSSAPLGAATEGPDRGLFPSSRSAMALAGWMFGAGLSFLLRSVSLMVFAAIAAGAASAYIRCSKGPAKMAPMTQKWKLFGKSLLGWLSLALIAVGTLAGFPAVTQSVPVAHLTEPAILVQIRCKPGTADLWREDFEQHIRPAIDEAIARGDGYTSFQFLQPALPGQGFDFALLYTGKTYAALDQPRIPPQYLVLLEREGPLRTMATVREMSAWEDQVTVSLVHLSRTR